MFADEMLFIYLYKLYIERYSQTSVLNCATCNKNKLYNIPE